MVGSRKNLALFGVCFMAVLGASSAAKRDGRLLKGYRSTNYGCDHECVWCESGVCDKCKSGWHVSNGRCVKDNCGGCSQHCDKCDCGRCWHCKSGYIPNAHGGCDALKNHHSKVFSTRSSGCSGWGCSSGSSSSSVSIKTSSSGFHSSKSGAHHSSG
ncbi:hypothetical protein BSKO_13268 [Bryopsis sp. KO-2023]|nr:hypothetical protein BSKO_13268 [Bryopsis sp. KO-2023]